MIWWHFRAITTPMAIVRWVLIIGVAGYVLFVAALFFGERGGLPVCLRRTLTFAGCPVIRYSKIAPDAVVTIVNFDRTLQPECSLMVLAFEEGMEGEIGSRSGSRMEFQRSPPGILSFRIFFLEVVG